MSWQALREKLLYVAAGWYKLEGGEKFLLTVPAVWHYREAVDHYMAHYAKGHLYAIEYNDCDVACMRLVHESWSADFNGIRAGADTAVRIYDEYFVKQLFEFVRQKGGANAATV
jgi:hypothetical protein